MTDPDVRDVRLFRNSCNHAARIPVDLEFPGGRARQRRDGERLMLEPVRKPGLLGRLAQWGAADEAPPENADAPAPREDILG